MKPDFVTTDHCKSRAHCVACRSADPSFRMSLRESFATPEDKIDFDCPHGVPWGVAPDPAEAQKRKEQLSLDEQQRIASLRAVWKEIHARALFYLDREINIPAEQLWIASIAERIGGCTCASHWKEQLAADPPDLASPERYARWSWRQHQAVNRRLGKPELPWTDACREHGWPWID